MAEGLRERKKRQTSDAIRTAALGLYLDQGYAETSVSQIAAAADVSERTFYRYYDSKEDVLLDDSRAYFAAVEAFLATRPSDESPMQSLRGVRGALEDDWTLGVELTWLSRLISENAAVRAHFLALTYDHHDRIANIFAERCGLTLADPRPRIWASAGISAYLNSTIMYAESDGSRSSWDYGDEILRAYCEGLEPIERREPG